MVSPWSSSLVARPSSCRQPNSKTQKHSDGDWRDLTFPRKYRNHDLLHIDDLTGIDIILPYSIEVEDEGARYALLPKRTFVSWSIDVELLQDGWVLGSGSVIIGGEQPADVTWSLIVDE